jgi:maleylpyruvate isomerase
MDFAGLGLAEQLVVARQGTVFFEQSLAGLNDRELDGDSTLAGWSRKHLVAHVGYNAIALCRLMDWAATGVETPMYESPSQRSREIEAGGTLDGTALRALIASSSAQLDEKWRNLPAAAWASQVRTAQGRVVPAQETVWMRTREVWIHAADLDNGATFADLPTVVLTSLTTDIVDLWRRRGVGSGIVLDVQGSSTIAVQPHETVSARISGPLPSVAQWASGRGALDLDSGSDIEAPAWL